jgi:DDE superfamily endonuclease
VLLPSALQRFPTGFKFVQDNSSVHTAKVIRRWFQDQPQIDKIDWPPKAGDLNPIENIWGIMVNRLNSKLVSKKKLWDSVFNMWEELAMRPDIWIDLVYSMPDRLNMCIDLNGDWTKY